MTEINDRTKDELIKELERTKGYLEDNYRELQARHSTYLKTHFQEIGAVKCQKSIEDYAHALCNYLSSYAASIEHMMKVRNKLKNEELKKTYADKLESSKLLVEQKFVKDLRNYIEHYGIPEMGTPIQKFSELIVSEGKLVGIKKDFLVTINFAPTMDSEELKKWGGWQKESRAYLESLKLDRGRVRPHFLVDFLHKSNIDFLNWLIEEIRLKEVR